MNTNKNEQNLLDSEEWLRFDLDKLQASGGHPVLEKFFADYAHQIELTAAFRCPHCRHSEVRDEQGHIVTRPEKMGTYSVTCDSPLQMRLETADFTGKTLPTCLGFDSKE